MITCFGEYLLRLSPPSANRFTQATSFDVIYGGAEANTAAALVGFGEKAAYVTKLPDNAIGDAALCSIRKLGVDTTHILRGGERIGIYFLERGSGVRPSKVVYDRRHSAIAEASPDEYDWNKILNSTDIFFFTGITPAVSENTRKLLSDALSVCRKNGIKIVCDLNYRSTLWSAEEAKDVMRESVQGIDTLIANEEHAALLLGISSDSPDENTRLREISEAVSQKYSINQVVITLRRSISSDVNAVCAALYDKKTDKFCRANEYEIHITDRVGGGDALSAGIIYGNLHGFTPEKTIEFAVAANAFKHSIPGDTLLATADEIEAVMSARSGDGTVRMLR